MMAQAVQSTRPMLLSFVVSKDDAVQLLSKLEMRLSSPSIAGFLGQVVDPYIRRRARDRFAEEGDDVSGPWEPLSETTQRIRESMGYGPTGPINVRTTQMERYVTQSPERLVAHSLGATLYSPGGNPTGELRSKLARAQGSKRKVQGRPGRRGGGMGFTPPRPVIGVNERDLIWTMGALKAFVEGG